VASTHNILKMSAFLHSILKLKKYIFDIRKMCTLRFTK